MRKSRSPFLTIWPFFEPDREQWPIDLSFDVDDRIGEHGPDGARHDGNIAGFGSRHPHRRRASRAPPDGASRLRGGPAQRADFLQRVGIGRQIAADAKREDGEQNAPRPAVRLLHRDGLGVILILALGSRFVVSHQSLSARRDASGKTMGPRAGSPPRIFIYRT